METTINTTHTHTHTHTLLKTNRGTSKRGLRTSPGSLLTTLIVPESIHWALRPHIKDPLANNVTIMLPCKRAQKQWGFKWNYIGICVCVICVSLIVKLCLCVCGMQRLYSSLILKSSQGCLKNDRQTLLSCNDGVRLVWVCVCVHGLVSEWCNGYGSNSKDISE